jgi:DNA-directed RNA polymerase subunit omega
MDEIESQVDSKFRYVLLAARRAEQLIRGANARVGLRSSKVARVAMEEILDGCVDWDYGPAPAQGAQEGDAAAATEAASSPAA